MEDLNLMAWHGFVAPRVAANRVYLVVEILKRGEKYLYARISKTDLQISQNNTSMHAKASSD